LWWGWRMVGASTMRNAYSRYINLFNSTHHLPWRQTMIVTIDRDMPNDEQDDVFKYYTRLM
jgi:hypothetical protein